MGQKDFKYETVLNPAKGSILVMLVGTLDEQAELPSADEFKGMSEVEYDFRGLQFINSVGITKFIRLNGALEKDLDPKFYFTKCPRFIIDMINTIDGFLPMKGEVKSFDLPVFCENCEKLFSISQDVHGFTEENLKIENLASGIDCDQYPRCADDLKIDIMPKLFFRFLRK